MLASKNSAPNGALNDEALEKLPYVRAILRIARKKRGRARYKRRYARIAAIRYREAQIAAHQISKAYAYQERARLGGQSDRRAQANRTRSVDPDRPDVGGPDYSFGRFIRATLERFGRKTKNRR